ncbi:hypothetical protein PGB90_003048 [Kerria lacca]
MSHGLQLTRGHNNERYENNIILSEWLYKQRALKIPRVANPASILTFRFFMNV